MMKFWVVCVMVVFTGFSFSQELTKADSGWVPLFNGQDFEGLRVVMYNQNPRFSNMETQNYFSVENEEIHAVGVGAGNGHVGTETEFTHYKMRVQYKFGDNTGSGSNAGLMYHLDDYFTPYMGGQWPRSIECQMKKDQTADAFSIVMVTYEVPSNNPGSCEYNEGGRDSITSNEQVGCRQTKARPENPNPYVDKAWNDMSLVVRGHKRATHYAQGKKLLELFNIRVPDGSGWKDYGTGTIALQIEGAQIAYRNWEIMELPEDGPDFLNRIMVTSPVGGETLIGGSQHNITWKSIGDFDKVNIEYSANGGQNWVSVQPDAPNSGTYAWTLPPTATQQAKIRLLGPESWVQAGESPGAFTIEQGSDVLEFQSNAKLYSIKISGVGEIFSSFVKPEKVWITDVRGQSQVIVIPETDAQGASLDVASALQSGMYFLNVKSKQNIESKKFVIQ